MSEQPQIIINNIIGTRQQDNGCCGCCGCLVMLLVVLFILAAIGGHN